MSRQILSFSRIKILSEHEYRNTDSILQSIVRGLDPTLSHSLLLRGNTCLTGRLRLSGDRKDPDCSDTDVFSFFVRGAREGVPYFPCTSYSMIHLFKFLWRSGPSHTSSHNHPIYSRIKPKPNLGGYHSYSRALTASDHGFRLLALSLPFTKRTPQIPALPRMIDTAPRLLAKSTRDRPTSSSLPFAFEPRADPHGVTQAHLASWQFLTWIPRRLVRRSGNCASTLSSVTATILIQPWPDPQEVYSVLKTDTSTGVPSSRSITDWLRSL